jgi:transcription antitermination protein NusB
MSRRREGRETAVQLLFSREFVPGGGEHDVDGFFKLHTARSDVRAHAEKLYRGVAERLVELDALIVPVLENFSMERLDGVDRNILRVALYEMHHCLDVPPVVAISEAIEIAKRYGGDQSARFVNGVLDKLKAGVQRPLREASRAPRPQRHRDAS